MPTEPDGEDPSKPKILLFDNETQHDPTMPGMPPDPTNPFIGEYRHGHWDDLTVAERPISGRRSWFSAHTVEPVRPAEAGRLHRRENFVTVKCAIDLHIKDRVPRSRPQQEGLHGRRLRLPNYLRSSLRSRRNSVMGKPRYRARLGPRGGTPRSDRCPRHPAGAADRSAGSRRRIGQGQIHLVSDSPRGGVDSTGREALIGNTVRVGCSRLSFARLKGPVERRFAIGMGPAVCQ